MRKDVLSSDLRRILLAYCAGGESPVLQKVQLLLTNQDWDGLASLKLDPGSYVDAGAYFRDATAVALLRKYPGLPTSFDRKANALRKWREGEDACFKTNLRLGPYLHRSDSNVLTGLTDPRIDEFITDVRNIVQECIGTDPGQFERRARFGPGATQSLKAKESSLPEKVIGKPSLTSRACMFVADFLDTRWGKKAAELHGELSYVRGNRYSTAPKDATIHRSIAMEPDLNVFYQLAVDETIKTRLAQKGSDRGWSWDLREAQEIHKAIALRSSVSAEFATADLVNASDTVAYNLVRLLLPRAWFRVLEALRSPCTEIEERFFVLEKFSSMGNGFTFTLETVLFAAIAMAVTRRHGFEGKLGKDVFVFGDDIIVRDELYEPLVSCLAWFGFEVNTTKSFHGTTPFRESCGGDYLRGEDVRPFYLKEEVNGPQDWFSLANGLYRNLKKAEQLQLDLTSFRRAYFRCLDNIPTALRALRGPEAFGDLVLREDDCSKWHVKVEHSIRYVRALIPKTPSIRAALFEDDVVLTCLLLGAHPKYRRRVSEDGEYDELWAFPVRGAPPGYKVKWLPYS